MTMWEKNYVVKPPLIDVKCQFSYFTHNNCPKLKLDELIVTTWKRLYNYKVG